MGLRLYEQADRDIQVAEKLVSPGSYYAAANFAHQAAEKALKAAYWHIRGEEPPWNHDLVKCSNRVAESAGGIPAAVEAAIEELQPIFEQSRYPSGNINEPIPAEMVSEEDARRSLRLAKEVMSWVEPLLQQPSVRTRHKTNY